jgi:hypothetical protein
MEHIGIEVAFRLDLAAGYQVFLHWLYRDDENFLIINPNIYFQLATLNHIAFKLYWIEWWFRFNIIAEKFTPVDYQALWSLDNMDKYCHSVSWVQEVFIFELKVEQRVMECQFGALGWIPNDGTFGPLDCWWRTYAPQLDLWSTSFVNEWDFHQDYFPWQCLDDPQVISEEQA